MATSCVTVPVFQLPAAMRPRRYQETVATRVEGLHWVTPGQFESKKSEWKHPDTVSQSLSFLSCSPCLLKQVFLSSNFKIKASDLLVNALPTKQLNLTLLCIVTVNSFIYLRWTNFIIQIREYSGTSPTLLLSLSLWIVVMACFQFIAQAQAQLFIMWRMQKMTSRKKVLQEYKQKLLRIIKFQNVNFAHMDYIFGTAYIRERHEICLLRAGFYFLAKHNVFQLYPLCCKRQDFHYFL